MSLHKCWAEKVSDANTKVEFWNEFCPRFDWVAPEVVADTAAWNADATKGFGYLKVAWDRKSSIQAINFRNISTNIIYFLLDINESFNDALLKLNQTGFA